MYFEASILDVDALYRSLEMKILLSALILSVSAASANPIATPPVKEATIRKTWERCMISVGRESATVSCAVGYLAKNFLEYPVYVSVPAFVPKGTDFTPASLQKILRPRLETKDKVIEPIWISASGPSNEDASAECRFGVGQAPDKEFSIIVSYEQPLIEGRLLYLPLFEGGESPALSDDFTVTIFPEKGMTLVLESKHGNKVSNYRTRITVHPLHKELIKIAAINSEKVEAPNRR